MHARAPERLVWIASYPKSGNTWVRFMLANLLFGRQESAAGLGALIPDIHEFGALPTHPPAGLLKTHHAFSPQLAYAAQTAAAIYVVRHPADVLASNFFYAQRRGAQTPDSSAAFDEYFERFLGHRGDPHWIERGMGSWEENVRSWRSAAHPFPVLTIRYEDLSANPDAVCAELAKLLRPDSTEDEIRRAVQDSSFQRMREIERADIREKRVGIFYKPYLQASIDSGRRFMRRGVVGDGAARLTAAQRERLHGAFEPLMRELNYSIAA
jgi:hypothetical protein